MMGKIGKSSSRCGLLSVSFCLLIFCSTFHGCLGKHADPVQSDEANPGVTSDTIHQSKDEGEAKEPERYKIISFNFQHVEVPYVVCLWILLASIAKIGFHLYDKLSHIFPESCVLISLGIVVGVTLYYTETANSQQYSLDANSFFLFLLPPIIYDAGYHMPNRAFFNNLGTILLLAVVNTLWNTLGIGLGLWGMSYLGWIHKEISILHAFVFSALISAVDPVAVLAIFEEIQVNEILYILVFGESLLNDGVTVVIYHMMEGFTEIGENNLQAIDFVMGIASFFIVVLGGTLIGIIYGLIGAFITKYTDHVRIMEPLFIFVLGYLAYLTAECLELSSILALTFGGIVMRHYTEINMAKKSTTTVKYFMKMMANISETIIFMFLGLSTVIDNHEWHLDFILFTLLFCLIFRVTGVIALSFLVNRRRLIRLSAIDQFIMSYGGLRGGIAFCLALLLDKHHIPEKSMFVTTTVVIVFFTVFVQGITIKPVVNALKVERAEEHDPSMNEIFHRRAIDHLMAGIEDIVGRTGHNSLSNKFEHYNTLYLKPWLLREKPKSRDTSILRVFTKLNIQDAKEHAKAFPGGLSRDPSMSRLNSHSPSVASFSNSRRAQSGDLGLETVVNMHSTESGLGLDKGTAEEMSMQQMLEEAMLRPRPGWSQERRHTLADIHNNSDNPLHPGGMPIPEHFGNNSRAYNHPTTVSPRPVAGRKLRKNVSFTSSHSRLGKKLSDVVEQTPQVQESSFTTDSYVPAREVVFTVGMPAPEHASHDADLPEPPDLCPPPDSPISIDLPTPNNEPSQSAIIEATTDSPSTSGVETSTSANSPPSKAPRDTNMTVYSALMHTSPTLPPSLAHLQLSGSPLAKELEPDSKNPIVDDLVGKVTMSRGDDSGQGSSSPVCDDPDQHSDQDHPEDLDLPVVEETLAQSSLPWRRQTGLPPVPSSISLSLPDDENPLMSEAPSWANNLDYNHLTETGSPYHSPHNTIVANSPPSNPRPVFDIFPPSSPSPEEASASIPPPPWNLKDEDSGHVEEEPLPSHAGVAESGDKASCFLVSAHDRVPPSHHSCLELGSHMRHVNSVASSPAHFQLMDKDVDGPALQTELIGIESDYYHGMCDRVSQWLASSPPNSEGQAEGTDTHDNGEMILESLRKKKEQWRLEDVGSEADDESDCDVFDTKL